MLFAFKRSYMCYYIICMTLPLKECKYIKKEKKEIRHITDDLEKSSDDFDESDED